MNKPQLLGLNQNLTLAIADWYEYAMARANQQENIAGQLSVFDMVVRRMPTNKVIEKFEHDGVKYDKLQKRDFLINAGLEQVAAYLLEAKGSKQLRDYIATVQGIQEQDFLTWVENAKFQGNLYAMPEGTIFFAQEHQLRLHGPFEEAQLFESLILNTINPQTNVATTANDIAQVAPEKILLEGGSRRATSPQSAIFNSRAARIGGFTASSNVAYGMLHTEKVGGTHGHSYVMLHPTEYSAFKAQTQTLKNNVCFLLDTYNVKDALETALKIIEEEHVTHAAFRIDSGDLLSQARYIHHQLESRGFTRDKYTLFASDDLNAEKIAALEREGAGIDKYLVGTFVVNPPKPVEGVYKLAAYEDKEGEWHLKGKLSADLGKSTLPGIKQIYRIAGSDGFYKRDIIAFEGEDISNYMDRNDAFEPLLIPIIEKCAQVYDFPTIDQIAQRRSDQLSRFKDISTYEVIISEKIRVTQRQIMSEHGL